MSTVGKDVIKSLKEAINGDVGETIVVSVDLDEIKRRYPPDISNEDFKRIIEVERGARAGWLGKQAAKGKEE